MLDLSRNSPLAHTTTASSSGQKGKKLLFPPSVTVNLRLVRGQMPLCVYPKFRAKKKERCLSTVLPKCMQPPIPQKSPLALKIPNPFFPPSPLLRVHALQISFSFAFAFAIEAGVSPLFPRFVKISLVHL